MLGAFVGDIVGVPHEFNQMKDYNFEFFTDKCNFSDDSICTAAVCDWLLEGKEKTPVKHLRNWCIAFPMRGYGGYFHKWILDDTMGEYDSWGNGSAMRVSPVAYFAEDKDELMHLAKMSAKPTHGHDKAVKGAQATALAIYRAIEKRDPEDILQEIRDDFGYKLDREIDDIRETYKFYVDCERTVPPALICALKSNSFEDAVRNAVSLGGDADTVGAITGSIAEPLFEIPDDIASKTFSMLPNEIRRLYVRFANEMNK